MNAQFDWDETKRRINLDQHQLDFADVHGFGWDEARVEPSDRHEESRWVAYGNFDDQLHAVVFTMRGDVIRIISFRRARPREVAKYG